MILVRRAVLVLVAFALTLAAGAGWAPPAAAQQSEIEAELEKARAEKREFVVVALASGGRAAFHPDAVTAVTGSRVTLRRAAVLVQGAFSEAVGETKAYFILRYLFFLAGDLDGISDTERGIEASYERLPKAGAVLEVARFVSVPELEPLPGGKGSPWEAVELREMGFAGEALSRVSVATRKIEPKAKFEFDTLVVRLANPGETGLAPDLEAAFFAGFAERQSKRFASVVNVMTAEAPSTGASVLEVTFRLYHLGDLGIAYQSVDRSSGEVRHRGFGRGHLGTKAPVQDAREVAALCALPQ
jgi:hypothetical protein